MAVQIAKEKGAYVIATASARNHDYLRALGADEIIDYQAMRFDEMAEEMDVVLDTVGGETQERSWKVLKWGNRNDDPVGTGVSRNPGANAARGLPEP